MLELEPCTQKLMRDVFMPLELPAAAEAPSQPDQYNTIGQFYAAIIDGFERLSSPKLWSNPRADLQYDEAYWNQDGGRCRSSLPTCRARSMRSPRSLSRAKARHPAMRRSRSSRRRRNSASRSSRTTRSSRASLKGSTPSATYGSCRPTPAARTSRPRRPARRTLRRRLLLRAVHARRLYTKSTNAPAGQAQPPLRRRTQVIAAMGGLLYPIADLLVRQLGATRGTNAAPTFGFYRFDAPRKMRSSLRATPPSPTFPVSAATTACASSSGS